MFGVLIFLAFLLALANGALFPGGFIICFVFCVVLLFYYDLILKNIFFGKPLGPGMKMSSRDLL